MLENTLQESAQTKEEEKKNGKYSIKCGLNASVIVFVCLFRAIQLFSFWKYLTLLHLLLLKVIIPFFQLAIKA